MMKITKRTIASLLVCMMLFTSFAFAAELPDNYLVINDKAVDLEYAMQNKEAFNEILSEYINNEGAIDDLYVVIGEVVQDVYGNTLTPEQKDEIVNKLVTLVNSENPDGTLIAGDLEEKVAEIEGLIAELPDAEEVTEENVEEVKAQMQEIEGLITALLDEFADYNLENLEGYNKYLAVGQKINEIENPVEIKVVSVSAINDVEVEFGTSVEELGLPSEVEVTLSNEEKDVANVEWNTENYDPELSGEQVLNGTLVVPEGKEWTIPEELATVTVKVIVGEDTRVEVKEVKAINATTVEVTFAEDVELTEEDLVDKLVTLTESENTLTAKYIEASLSEGKARFLLADSKKLEDAKIYTVSADWAKFATDTFIAKVADPYIKTITVTTKSVPAIVYGEGSTGTKIYFTAKDQYGNDIVLTEDNVEDLKVYATLNGMPLTTDELPESVDTSGTITIKKTLVEGSKLVVTFKNKIGEDTVVVGSKEFTVGKAAKPVPTSLGKIKAVYTEGENAGKAVESLAANDKVTLSVDVVDQFGNPMENQKVRWYVEEGNHLIIVTEPAKIPGDAVEMKFTAKSAGDIKISAFLENGQKSTYTATIGAAKLESLEYAKNAPSDEYTITDQDKYYNKDTLLVRIVTPNKGATLTPEMIKFEVKANTKDTTVNDITVTASLRGDVDENCPKDKEKEIVIVVKSTKPGNYTITPYVGESLEKAVAKGSKFNVTTKIDEFVKTIDPITFESTELKVNKEIKKDIVFRNKHGEVVVVNGVKLDDVTLNVAPASGLTASIGKNEDSTKNILTLEATKAGQYAVTVVKDDGFINIPLTFTIPKLANIKVGSNITGVVAGDPEEKAVYSEIKFLDQDNVEMSVKKSELSVTVTKPDGSELEEVGNLITLGKSYTVDEDGNVYFEVANDDDAVVAYKVLPSKDLVKGTYTVKIADANNEKIASEFTVKVGAARVVKTIELIPETTILAVYGETTLNIVPEDQYGDFINVDDVNDIVVISTDDKVIEVSNVSKVRDEDNDLIGYKVTVTGKAKGSSEVTVKINNTDIEAKETFTVNAAESLVDSVKISTKGIKDLYSTETVAAVVYLKATAKDAEGNIIPGTDLIWSVAQVNRTSQTGTVDVDSEGKVTADTGFVGSATIEVMAVKIGGTTTTDSITLNFDNAPSAPVMSTLKVVDDKNKEVTELEISKETNIKLVAKDQYDNDFDFSSEEIQILVGDKTILTATNNGGTITVKPVNGTEGTTTLIIHYNGKTFTIPVKVVPADEE